MGINRAQTSVKNFAKKIPVFGQVLKGLRDAANDFAGQLLEHRLHLRATSRSEAGVNEQKRQIPLVVSLTSIPQRLKKLHLCVESLLSQSLKPDRLILWLSEDIKKGKLSENLLRMEKRGLRIRFCRDIRSYKKIIPALRENPESVIVTADDDAVYPENWLKELYEAYEKEPNLVHCHRAHLMDKNSAGRLKKYKDWNHLSQGEAGPSFLLFPTGVGGVLYPPGALSREVMNEKIFMDICPYNDDIWLKAMSLINGTRCKKTKPFFREFYTVRGSQSFSLYSQNVVKGKNDEQIETVFSRYDLLRLL